MKFIFSLLIIIQLILSPVLAQDHCSDVRTSTAPLSQAQEKVAAVLMNKMVCLNDQSQLVVSKVLSLCFVEIAKGAFEFVISQIEGVISLIEMSYKLASKFGSFMMSYIDASIRGTLPIFMAEQYIQGNDFFNNIAKSLSSVPQMITGYLQAESDHFRCLPVEEKVGYICHASARILPEVIMVAMGLVQGVKLAKSIYPKLSQMLRVEKGITSTATATATAKTATATKIVLRTEKIINSKNATQQISNAAQTIANKGKVAIANEGKTLAKTIEYFPRSISEIEYKMVGTIIEDAEQLKNLEDGAYIFLIDSKGNLVISPRYPDLNANLEIVANHPALKNKLNQKYRDLDPSSAGEFYIDGGEISEINNKSGRYHGDKSHLDFGTKILKSKGLEIKPEAKIRDFAELEKDIQNGTSYRDPEHISEIGVAKKIKENFSQNPKLVQEFNDFKTVYKNICKNLSYKSQNLGKPNLEKITDQFLNYMDNHPENINSAVMAMYYTGDITTESARHFKTYFGMLKYKTEERIKALELLQHMAKNGKLPD